MIDDSLQASSTIFNTQIKIILKYTFFNSLKVCQYQIRQLSSYYIYIYIYSLLSNFRISSKFNYESVALLHILLCKISDFFREEAKKNCFEERNLNYIFF